MAFLLWFGLLPPDLAPSSAPHMLHSSLTTSLLPTPPTPRQVLRNLEMLCTKSAPSLPSGLCSNVTSPIGPIPTVAVTALLPPPWLPAFPVPHTLLHFPKALTTFSPTLSFPFLSCLSPISPQCKLPEGHIFVCFVYFCSTMAYSRCFVHLHRPAPHNRCSIYIC